MPEFLSNQVDAAGIVEEAAKVDDGRGAQALRWREEEERDEEARGKVKGTPGPIYKAERISGMRGNRGG